jgi:hypothetical protein
MYRTIWLRKQPERYNASIEIPFVVICYNNLTFVKNFVNQLLRFPNPIILIDNASAYPPMHDYYKELRETLSHRVTIHTFNENHGHFVYVYKGDLLPNQFILSDPDLQLHPDMPINVAERLLAISNEYKMYKVGAALDLSDRHLFATCPYAGKASIYDHEKQFWTKPMAHPLYELYRADLDTTFCLINRDYLKDDYYSAIRVAGVFTAKHLPWYKGYIRKNIPQDELEYWTQNNISSSVLSCLD